MAAHGGTVIAGAGGTVTQLDTGSLNVTGADLCLVTAASEEASGNPTMTILWDPAVNNESMTGTINTVSAGAYIDHTQQYLDNPTAANGVIRLNLSASTQCTIAGSFFTAAGDIVTADSATDSDATTSSSLSATPGNVVSGDMVVDSVQISYESASSTLVAGANQTNEGVANAGTYLQGGVSTQAGADGGTMSWTYGTCNYGASLCAVRVPDVGGGGGGGRTMGSLANSGGLAGMGGIAGQGGGIAG